MRYATIATTSIKLYAIPTVALFGNGFGVPVCSGIVGAPVCVN
ncbi:hypothetical protein [Hydrocarboniclastica marina]|nr:hypothetical protein [Hydrocarboniclastica marina]